MKILYSAYWCNPFRGSEWQAGFRWLEILLKKYEVILFTSNASEKSLLKFYNEKPPDNLRIITFKDENFIPRKIREVIHLEYFIYNNNVKRFIENNPEEDALKNIDLILHKNPSSFRYYNNLYKVNKPLVIGPIGGGLQIPDILKKYLKGDSWIRKLRKYDRLLFKVPVYKKQFEKADKILISLDFLRDFIPKKYGSKIKTIFDTGISVENAFIERKKSPDDQVKILTIGRLILAKGTALTIKALSKLTNSNFHLDIVGDGPERAYLENLTKELNLSSRITFHGNVPYNEVDQFYKAADIFCFPSLKEAGGTVLLEAMKFGLPIITMNYGGPKFLCPASGALKIPISGPDEIIQALHKKLELLIQSPELRQKMGKVNYNYCKENYTWEKIENDIHNLIALYK